jgi:hypothetical protein
MKKEQGEAFNILRKTCHDEGHDCKNLAMLLRVAFPEDLDDNLTSFIHKVAVPYLDVRAELGENVMQVIYELEKEERNDI